MQKDNKISKGQLEQMVHNANRMINESSNEYKKITKDFMNLSEDLTVGIYCEGGQDYIPKYQTNGSSGLDLMAYISEDIVIEPMQRVLIPTGIYVDLPSDYEFQIRPRSGLAYKQGLTVLNSPGTIDDDYIGEIKVLAINLSNQKIVIKSKDRIAQMVLQKVPKLKWKTFDNTDSFNSKNREGGFGSTGV